MAVYTPHTIISWQKFIDFYILQHASPCRFQFVASLFSLSSQLFSLFFVAFCSWVRDFCLLLDEVFFLLICRSATINGVSHDMEHGGQLCVAATLSHAITVEDKQRKKTPKRVVKTYARCVSRG